MKKKYLLIIYGTFLLILIFFAKIAFANTNFRSGQNVTLPQTATINANYFATGSNVVISGIVNGDVYAAGGNVTVDGTVNGDVLAAGGTISIDGKVSGNVRAVGGQIIVSGTVDKNISVGGGQVALQRNATVSGSLVAAGGNIMVLTSIGKSADLAGAQININSAINGDTTVVTGKLSLLPQAVIKGNITYWSSHQADIASGAKVTGSTTYNKANFGRNNQKSFAFFAGGSIGWVLFSLISAFVMGWIFITLFPVYAVGIAKVVIQRFWLSLGIGFLVAILFPIVVLILMATIIGIPIALILIAAMFVFFSLNKIFIAYAIGKQIIPQRVWLLAFIVGLIVYEIIAFIPVVNWIFGVIVFFVGLGAFVLIEKDMYHLLRTKKIL